MVIEGNDVSASNVVTDYNNNTSNPQGEPGGVAECITVATGCSNVITRNNDIHDSRQYGIDYKAGVKGGAIYGNRIWNIERHGIYIDAGRRFVEDVDIYDNQIWNCKFGIVLAREAGSNTIAYATFRAQEGAAEFVQTLRNIRAWNNAIWDTDQAGIYWQRHAQKDGPDGVIANIDFRFNTVSDANRDVSARDLNLSGWLDADMVAAGVTSGLNFAGNIIANADVAPSVLNTLTGTAGYTEHGNYIGQTPGFAAAAETLPRLHLIAGGAGVDLVTAAGSVDAPYATGIDGDIRSLDANAGAYVATAVAVSSVAIGTMVDEDLPVTITAAGATAANTVYWVLYPDGEDAPSAAQIVAGDQEDGSDATASGSGTWSAAFSATLPSEIVLGNYRLAVAIGGAPFSNVVVSGAFEVDTVVAPSGLVRGTTTQIIDSPTDKTSFASGADGGSSVTAAAGSNRMLTFVVYWTNRGTPPATAPTLTFGGVTATVASSFIAGGFGTSLAIYRIAEASIPAGASATTFVSAQDIYRVSAHLLEYSGVDQSTPFGSIQTAALNSTTRAVTLNVTDADSLVLSGAYWRGASGTAPVTQTTDSGGTLVEVVERSVGGSDDNGVGTIAEEDIAATGNVTHTFTASASSPVVVFAIELFEA